MEICRVQTTQESQILIMMNYFYFDTHVVDKTLSLVSNSFFFKNVCGFIQSIRHKSFCMRENKDFVNVMKFPF